LSARLDKQRVQLGEPFQLTIEVTHAPQDTYSLPQPLSVGELSLRAAPQIARKPADQSGNATTTFLLPLIDLKTLTPKVPDISLLIEGPEGPRALTVPGQPLELVSVVKTDEDGKQTKEQGPRGPKAAIPIYIRSYLWIAVIAGLVAFCALVYAAAVLGKRARAAREIVNVPSPLTPDEEALHRIAALRMRKPWERGLSRATIFELSEIVRVYLGKRLQFDAIDLTTDELLRELRRRRILGLDLAELTEELSWEGLVKFAKLEPTGDECLQALDRAAELVERTRPVAQLAAAPTAAEARA
jgi:hypothetical protein